MANHFFLSQVGKAKGILKNFLIEPFVAHKQVKVHLNLQVFVSLEFCYETISQKNIT